MLSPHRAPRITRDGEGDVLRQAFHGGGGDDDHRVAGHDETDQNRRLEQDPDAREDRAQHRDRPTARCRESSSALR